MNIRWFVIKTVKFDLILIYFVVFFVQTMYMKNWTLIQVDSKSDIRIQGGS